MPCERLMSVLQSLVPHDSKSIPQVLRMAKDVNHLALPLWLCCTHTHTQTTQYIPIHLEPEGNSSEQVARLRGSNCDSERLHPTSRLLDSEWVSAAEDKSCPTRPVGARLLGKKLRSKPWCQTLGAHMLANLFRQVVNGTHNSAVARAILAAATGGAATHTSGAERPEATTFPAVVTLGISSEPSWDGQDKLNYTF